MSTSATSGVRVSREAFVEDAEALCSQPLAMSEGDALQRDGWRGRRGAGAGGGGGALATRLWQPAGKRTTPVNGGGECEMRGIFLGHFTQSIAHRYHSSVCYEISALNYRSGSKKIDDRRQPSGAPPREEPGFGIGRNCATELPSAAQRRVNERQGQESRWVVPEIHQIRASWPQFAAHQRHDFNRYNCLHRLQRRTIRAQRRSWSVHYGIGHRARPAQDRTVRQRDKRERRKQMSLRGFTSGSIVRIHIKGRS